MCQPQGTFQLIQKLYAHFGNEFKQKDKTIWRTDFFSRLDINSISLTFQLSKINSLKDTTRLPSMGFRIMSPLHIRRKKCWYLWYQLILGCKIWNQARERMFVQKNFTLNQIELRRIPLSLMLTCHRTPQNYDKNYGVSF